MIDGPHFQNLAAEKAVLGALFLRQNVPAGLDLDPFDFTSSQHRAVYRAMQETGKVDPILVVARLNETGRMNEAGGQAAVEALAVSVPAVAHLAEYVAELKRCRKWRLRRSAWARFKEALDTGNDELWLRGEAWVKGEATNVIDLQSRRAS